MSSTSQITTFSDCYTDLMNRTREETGHAATVVQAKRYINIALHDMHLGTSEKFPWAERQAILRTKAKYDTGTVTATPGSASILGSGTAWNTNDDFGVPNCVQFGKVLIGGYTDVYGVLSVNSDTAMTLSTEYIGSANSGLSYTYFENVYTLASDFLRPVDAQVFDDNASIELVGRTEFRRRFPRGSSLGTPRFASFFDQPSLGNTTRRRLVRFFPAPQEAQLIRYSYVTTQLACASDGTKAENLSADTDEPIVPLQYRHAIVYGALAKWYRDRKDDAREASAMADYTSVMARIISDTEVGGNRAHFRPRVTSYVRNARRPWRSSGRGRYDTGGRFDRLED